MGCSGVVEVATVSEGDVLAAIDVVITTSVLGVGLPSVDVDIIRALEVELVVSTNSGSKPS